MRKQAYIALIVILGSQPGSNNAFQFGGSRELQQTKQLVSPVTTKGRRGLLRLQSLRIWVEEAEPSFDDEEDENLEQYDDEICWRHVRAFANHPDDPENSKRFLCAGALVQRNADSLLFDAWTADALHVEDGGPNLQLQGAVKVLDDLFLHHLRLYPCQLKALQTFVLRCGDLESEETCSSHMAALARGFKPLKHVLEEGGGHVYCHFVNLDDYEEDIMVFDYPTAVLRYQHVVREGSTSSPTAQAILDLLPKSEFVMWGDRSLKRDEASTVDLTAREDSVYE